VTFSNTIVAAAWPVSFATETVQPAFRMPKGWPAPEPSKMASSVMNMISSLNACMAIVDRTEASRRISSVTYMTDIIFFRSSSISRNFGLLAVMLVPSATHVEATPPQREPDARLVSSTPGILIPLASVEMFSFWTLPRMEPMSYARVNTATKSRSAPGSHRRTDRRAGAGRRTDQAGIKRPMLRHVVTRHRLKLLAERPRNACRAAPGSR
jgi:hypothetical protein